MMIPSQLPAARKGRTTFILLALVLLGFGLYKLTQAPPEYVFSVDSFAGPIQITARDRSITEGKRDYLMDRMPVLLTELELALDTRNPRSKLAQFNASTNTTPFDAGPRLWRLVDLFAQLSTNSGGAVDIGHADLHTLWQRVAAGNRPPPDELDVRRELAVAGTERMVIPASPFFRRTEVNVKLHFGDLIDGYVAETVGSSLEENGIRNYEVTVHGAVVQRSTGTGRATIQPGPDLGIDHPAKIAVRNMAVHTLPGPALKQVVDYRTGYPSTNRVLAVSVVARDGLSASGLASVLRILGPDEGRPWLTNSPLAGKTGAEALWFVRKDDGGVETIATTNFPAVGP